MTRIDVPDLIPFRHRFLFRLHPRDVRIRKLAEGTGLS